MTYQSDRSWSDQFLPVFQRIVGPRLLEPSAFEIDTKEAADLVLIARDLRIACRVRKPGYASRYPWDFTVRAQRDNGQATELSKIADGWGDWLAYAHATDGFPPDFARWMIVDLHVFRSLLEGGLRGRRFDNHDGTHGEAFDVRSLPEELIVAASHRVPRDSMVAA